MSSGSEEPISFLPRKRPDHEFVGVVDHLMQVVQSTVPSSSTVFQ